MWVLASLTLHRFYIWKILVINSETHFYYLVEFWIFGMLQVFGQNPWVLTVEKTYEIFSSVQNFASTSIGGRSMWNLKILKSGQNFMKFRLNGINSWVITFYENPWVLTFGKKCMKHFLQSKILLVLTSGQWRVKFLDIKIRKKISWNLSSVV